MGVCLPSTALGPLSSVNQKKVRSGPISRVLSTAASLPLVGRSFLWNAGCPAFLATYPGVDTGPDRPVRRVLPRGACSLFGLAPRGVCLARLVTQPAGELLPHRFTLTGSGQRAGSRGQIRPHCLTAFCLLPSALCLAVYFLLHFPGPCGRWALPTTTSYGARTFLPETRRKRIPSERPAHSEPHSTILDEPQAGKVRWLGLW
jgi:hypothetical protein